ncbi:DUF6929 family protein [Flavobacterium solisilvae]|uniref:Apyrase n=1 Tax=Flavobacterium solisilvae TaxID=1852019 RepID=A0ABX1QTS7_9FLAO|nr:hypothetical protein [Flavobacterium solisilvae]NMH24895.1 hypothetical protein [Flavobacterium solisilvae]
MEKFQLSLLFKIIGLGSASGLLFQNNTILAIGDNSSYLYEYQTETAKLQRHPLAENAQENTPKAFKPDFEAITQYADSIYIFGSGSTENRNFMVQVDSKTKEVIKTQELTDLYLTMQSFAKIAPEDFNIEGVIYNGETWFFFNRGNGKTGKNVVFTVEGKNLVNEFQIISNEYKLPKIKGVRTSFTDAILVDNKIYFLASAENSNSTYDDGEVLGSIIGRIDVKKMKIDFTQKISDTHKFEGITLYKKSSNEIEFLLCEDNDTEVLEADIYKVVLSK